MAHKHYTGKTILSEYRIIQRTEILTDLLNFIEVFRIISVVIFDVISGFKKLETKYIISR